MILLTLFLTFFKIGILTFGGGYAMLPMIQAETLSHAWLSAEEIINFIAVSESTPGPFAVNISTYIGVVTAGLPGSLLATLGVVLPSFVIILIVARCYDRFIQNRTVQGIMKGLRPAVVGMIASAVLSVSKTVFWPDSMFDIKVILISGVIFVPMLVLALKKTHPILIIVISACAGILFGCLGLYA